MKLSKYQFICLQFQMVSYVLFLALVLGRCENPIHVGSTIVRSHGVNSIGPLSLGHAMGLPLPDIL